MRRKGFIYIKNTLKPLTMDPIPKCSNFLKGSKKKNWSNCFDLHNRLRPTISQHSMTRTSSRVAHHIGWFRSLDQGTHHKFRETVNTTSSLNSRWTWSMQGPSYHQVGLLDHSSRFKIHPLFVIMIRMKSTINFNFMIHWPDLHKFIKMDRYRFAIVKQ